MKNGMNKKVETIVNDFYDKINAYRKMENSKNNLLFS